jgi:hypothetical protein
MKLVFISNSPEAFTGFGSQSKLLATELKRRGHDIEFICHPCGRKGEFVEHHFTRFDHNWMDQKLEEIAPDAVICLESAQMLAELMKLRLSPANTNMYFWFPYEGNIPAPDTAGIFQGVPGDNVVHLSNYAKGLWSPAVRSDNVIYHCADSSVFKPLHLSNDQVRDLRNAWARRLKQPVLVDAPLLINVNRNYWHKRWDACFSILKILKEVHGLTCQMICHTARDNPRGGFNLPEMEKYYGLNGQIIYTDFDWSNGFTTEELNELYNICDMRIDTSSGEGFGCTVVEAEMAGIHQIVNSHTTMPELLPEENLVPSNGFQFQLGTIWAQPDSNAMAAKIANSFANLAPMQKRDHLKKFTVEEIANQWEDLLSRPHKQETNTRGFKTAIQDYDDMRVLSKVLPLFGNSVHNILPPDHFLKDVLDARSMDCNDTLLLGETSCDIAVLEGCLDDLLAWREPDDRYEIMDKLNHYSWVFIKDVRRYKWGQPKLIDGQFEKYLKIARRKDLEILANKKFPGFNFQIWDTGDGKSVPKGLKG